MRWLADERGLVLPLALLTLSLLAALAMVLAVTTRTEPVIAANHLRAAQARSLAESGLEVAIWALTNDRGAGGIPDPLPLSGDASSTPAPPWDGESFLAARPGAGATGGFTVAVRNDQSAGDPQVREITSTGWTPTNDSGDPRIKAHRTVFGRVVKLPDLGRAAPCALCVRGALAIGGNTTVNGRNDDARCGGDDKYGAYAVGPISAAASVGFAGGADGRAENRPDPSFDVFTYTATALEHLKALARSNGTYFGPGYPEGGFTHDGSTTWTGAATFDGSRRLPNGVVFVDTPDGFNVSRGTTGAPLAAVDILGDPFTGAPNPGSRLVGAATSSTAGEFTGVLVVNGTLSISGAARLNGVVYVVDALTYAGTGSGAVNGVVVTQNIRSTATTIDTSGAGGVAIAFRCDEARGAEVIPRGFGFVAGSYREVSR